MSKYTKQEWAAQQERKYESNRKHALLRGVLAQLEEEIYAMDGGVHTTGTRVVPVEGKDDEWGIVIGVAKRTDTFNRELGALRTRVANMLHRDDPKRTVFVYEEEPPKGRGEAL